MDRQSVGVEVAPEACGESGAPPEVDVQAVARTAWRLGRKKALAVARDMLRQQGLDDDAAAPVLARWTEEWEAPARGREELEARLDALQAENEAMGRRLAVIGRGIPAEMAERYVRLAESYPEAEDGFAGALDLALRDFPPAGSGEAAALPSFAAKTHAPRDRALTRERIEAMSPQELADHWSEVERFLEGQTEGRD